MLFYKLWAFQWLSTVPSSAMAQESVRLFFHTPGSYLGNDDNRMAIPGIQSINYEMSENTVAMEAIGYIKRMVKTEIRDYNYSAMNKLKEENKSLKHELAIAKK